MWPGAGAQREGCDGGWGCTVPGMTRCREAFPRPTGFVFWPPYFPECQGHSHLYYKDANSQAFFSCPKPRLPWSSDNHPGPVGLIIDSHVCFFQQWFPLGRVTWPWLCLASHLVLPFSDRCLSAMNPHLLCTADAQDSQAPDDPTSWCRDIYCLPLLSQGPGYGWPRTWTVKNPWITEMIIICTLLMGKTISTVS